MTNVMVVLSDCCGQSVFSSCTFFDVIHFCFKILTNLLILQNHGSFDHIVKDSNIFLQSAR